MSSTSSCNYNGYDYQADFWGQGKRDYEHHSEVRTANRLLRSTSKPFNAVLDAGCGFGRMFPSYAPLADSFVFLDYSTSMLEEAKTTIQTDKPTQFVQGSLDAMPLPDGSFSGVVSFRTLHHIQNVDGFLREAYRVLEPGGSLLFEIPNLAHVLNKCRFLLGRLSFNPFKDRCVKLGSHYFNYQPDWVLSCVKQAGFKVVTIQPISFFRIPWLKSAVPLGILLFLERLLQAGLFWYRGTPSLYVLCEKPS